MLPLAPDLDDAGNTSTGAPFWRRALQSSNTMAPQGQGDCRTSFVVDPGLYLVSQKQSSSKTSLVVICMDQTLMLRIDINALGA